MRYATIGILLLAWVLLACDEKEEVSGPSVPFPDYGEVLAFPGAEGYGRNAVGGRTWRGLSRHYACRLGKRLFA